MNIDLIRRSVLWNRNTYHCLFIFWVIYLEDSQYKATTIMYRFNAEDDTQKAKMDCYNAGIAYLQETLGQFKAYEFTPQFFTDGQVAKEYTVFAIAPYETPLSPDQEANYDPFFH